MSQVFIDGKFYDATPASVPQLYKLRVAQRERELGRPLTMNEKVEINEALRQAAGQQTADNPTGAQPTPPANPNTLPAVFGDAPGAVEAIGAKLNTFYAAVARQLTGANATPGALADATALVRWVAIGAASYYAYKSLRLFKRPA